MAGFDSLEKTNAHDMLLEATENIFSNKIKVLKNMLKSNRELFSKDILDQALLFCCRNGVLILMPDIITAGANIEVIDENGNTPLLLCALNRHESCAKYLIVASANINAVNFEGNTPLIASVLNGASHCVTKLLIGCRNIEIDHVNNNGCTALMYAIKAANLNAIKLLIDAKEIARDLDLNVLEIADQKGLFSLVNTFHLQNTTDMSPILQAVLALDLQTAMILISMDNLVLNSNDNYSYILIKYCKLLQRKSDVITQQELEMFDLVLAQVTANSPCSSIKGIIMDICLSIGDPQIIHRLIMLDFVISYRNLSTVFSKPDFLKFLLTQKHAINKLDSNNRPVYNKSPLQKALLEGEIESAKILMKHGAFMDIDLALNDTVKSNQEKSLKFLIEEFSDKVEEKIKSPKFLQDAIINSAVNIISVLLEHGADVNSEYDSKYCLSLAVDVNVLELLLTRGADPNLKDLHGRTALHLAAIRPNSVTTLELLIKYGADLNVRTYTEESPLRNAVVYEQIDNVQCLVDAGADINFLRKFTGKHVLFDADNKAILKILLDKGVDVKNIDGDSPLNWLLAKRNIGTENVKRLIDSGCEVNHKNKDGYTVLILATKHFDIPLLKLLIENGADVNASESKYPFKTALHVLFEKLWDYGKRATTCIHFLIDQNADIDKMHSSVIHMFITSGCLSLIPRFISRGLAPTYLTIKKHGKTFSPLMMALFLNQLGLACFFINIRYILKPDIDILYGNGDFPNFLEAKSLLNSIDFLTTFGQNILSLQSLCFVVLSETLGTSENRRLKVEKLELSQILKDLLLFKNASKTEIRDTSIKNQNLFKISKLNFCQHEWAQKVKQHIQEKKLNFC